MKRTYLLSILLSGSVVAALSLGYEVKRARASGIPTPTPLTYTGILTDPTGAPVTGIRNFDLRIFDQNTEGTLRCSFGPKAISVTAGHFQITLPDECTSIVHSLPNLWVEVFVDGGTLGRTKFGAVPYAVEADRAIAATTASSATAGGSIDQRLAALEGATLNQRLTALEGKKLDDRVTALEGALAGKLVGIWTVAPTGCVSIPHDTGWIDVDETAVSFSVPKPVTVWATYSINVQPAGATGEWVATRLNVDGTGAQMSGSHYQPISTADANANLVGNYVGELAAGAHTIKLQWGAVTGSTTWTNCPGWSSTSPAMSGYGARVVVVQAFYK